MRKHLAIFYAVAALLFGTLAIAADLYSNTLAVRAISPVTVSNNDNTDSVTIDGLGYSSVLYVITVKTVADTDATFTPVLLHGDNNALQADNVTRILVDNVAVPAAIRHGPLTAFGIADNNSVYMIEYAGTKRYTILRIAPASNTGAATFGAIAIKGFPQYRPVVR